MPEIFILFIYCKVTHKILELKKHKGSDGDSSVEKLDVDHILH